MKTYNYQEFKDNLDVIWTEVITSKDPAIISKHETKDCVLLPAAELSALQETLYLLQSRKNADRLFQAMERTDTQPPITLSIEEMQNFLGLDNLDIDDNWEDDFDEDN